LERGLKNNKRVGPIEKGDPHNLKIFQAESGEWRGKKKDVSSGQRKTKKGADSRKDVNVKIGDHHQGRGAP